MKGYKIACLEEIPYNNKWLSKEQVLKIVEPLSRNVYSTFTLIDVAKHY